MSTLTLTSGVLRSKVPPSQDEERTMGRLVGTQDVGELGFGCMGLSWAYASDGAPLSDKRALLNHVLDCGVRFLDTSDFYGPQTNEELIGSVVRSRRPDAFISTKGGLLPDPDKFMRVDGRPEHIAAACDGSLHRLGIDEIDLYQLHRVDPLVPLVETWGAMAELVFAGKVRMLGLCEVTAAQCDSVAEIHPVSAVQSELSVWERGALDHLVPWCEENDAAFIAYSPLGRGFLTGTLTPGTVFDSTDFRSRNPRFSPAALRENQRIVSVVQAIAEKLGATPAQVALAWALAVSPRVIPIPGTSKRHRFDENRECTTLDLGGADLKLLMRIEPPQQERY